jgi:hypothetical protein
MLRSEIIEAGHKVISALQFSGVQDVLRDVVHERGGRDLDSRRVVGALRQFAVASANFTEREIRILRIFDLEDLLKDEYWTEILERERGVAVVHNTYYKINQMLEILPNFLDLLHRASDLPPAPASRGGPERTDAAHEGAGPVIPPKRLTVILPETEGHLSTPKRVVMLMDSIEGLYHSAATLENLSPSDLAVAACDSGSDKSFDFTGISRIIESLRSILLEAYQCAIFWRERQFSERIKLVSESLPILSQIKSLEETNHLDQSKAELLRRQITDNISKFLQTGGRTPEMEQQSHFEPSALLRAQTHNQ